MDWSFAVDPLDVHSNRVDADREDIRDFFVGNALGQTIEDLLLTSGKLLDFLFRTAAFVEEFNEFAAAFDPAHLGQVDVHQQPVWSGFGYLGERLLPVAVATGADKPVRITNLARKVFTDPVVVLYNGNLNGHNVGSDVTFL